MDAHTYEVTYWLALLGFSGTFVGGSLSLAFGNPELRFIALAFTLLFASVLFIIVAVASSILAEEQSP